MLFPSFTLAFAFAISPSFVCCGVLAAGSSRRTVSLRSRPLAALASVLVFAALLFVRARGPTAAPPDGVGRGVLDDEVPAVQVVVLRVRERGGGVLCAREVDERPAERGEMQIRMRESVTPDV